MQPALAETDLESYPWRSQSFLELNVLLYQNKAAGPDKSSNACTVWLGLLEPHQELAEAGRKTSLNSGSGPKNMHD